MIRKAVIPAAGFGTRFLPATKSQPKEMLPIVDTPVIQYVVEEAVASGITDILIVIGKGKRAIEEHFDRNFYLEAQLKEQGKKEELARIRKISELADIHFVWQKELKGLGDAVNCAKLHVGDQPFAVLLGDALLSCESPATKQLVEVYDRHKESVVMIQQIERERVSRYGVISGEEISPSVYKLDGLVEKPTPAEAPSNLAVAGRYIFTPDIFDCLARIEPGKGGELQLTDAMQLMLAHNPMYGRLLDGKRYDIGNKQGFIKTNIEFALKSEDIADELKEYIKEIAKEL